MTTSAERLRLAALSVVLVMVVTVVAFLPILRNDFVNWDDVANFVMNPYYRGLGWTNLRWMFTSAKVGHYTPLAWVTHGVDYLLWGVHPRGYHLGNLVLHAATASVFFLVARRLLAAAFSDSAPTSPATRQRDADVALTIGATFAALVFAVHPLRVESVAWATERQDVLCGLLYLLAVLAYLRGIERGGMIQRPWWALSVSVFLLALLSKQAAMPLPVALLLIDIYPLKRVAAVGWRRLLLEKTPYLVLTAAIAPVALIAQSHANALAGFERYGLASRMALVAYSLTYYPMRFFWWADLSPLYHLPYRIHPLAPRFLFPIVSLGLVTAALVALRRRWPALLAAWVYSCLLVLPVSGAVHAGIHLVADRYSYFSGFGFAVLAGAALAWVLRARGVLKASVVGAALVAAVLLVAGMAAGTWRLSSVWLNTETLWRHVLSVDPRNYVVHYFLGNWLRATGRLDEALDEYRVAAELADHPGYKASSLEEIAALLNDQAVVHAKRGELDSARRLIGEALRVVPGYHRACHNLRTLAEMTTVAPRESESCDKTTGPGTERARPPGG